MTKRTKYMVQVNLSGLTGPLKMTWNGSDYWDRSGEFSCGRTHRERPGFRQMVFSNRKEAKACADGIKMALRELKSWAN